MYSSQSHSLHSFSTQVALNPAFMYSGRKHAVQVHAVDGAAQTSLQSQLALSRAQVLELEQERLDMLSTMVRAVVSNAEC